MLVSIELDGVKYEGRSITRALYRMPDPYRSELTTLIAKQGYRVEKQSLFEVLDKTVLVEVQ